MLQPYPYQAECLETLDNVRKKGIARALVVMASGLGKTVTVAFDAKRWLKEKGGRILYLCHNNDILYQAKTTFQAILDGPFTYGFFHGDEKESRRVDCLFASLQTMDGWAKRFDRKEFDYIVVDESHHSHAETYRGTVQYFQPKFLLGITATPDRMDRQNIREFYGMEVFYLPLEEALAKGLLTPVDYRLLSDEIQLGETLVTPIGKLSVSFLNRKIFIPKRDEEIARIITQHGSEFPEPRVMIFCQSVRHCEHLAQIVQGSFSIHSLIPYKERNIRTELFRQGFVNTAITIDCFNEGIDIPQANIVVFLRSIQSPNIFLQQLGRGLRRSEGKDRVLVLDFVGNCERIKYVYNLWQAVKAEQKKSLSVIMSGTEWDKGRIQPMSLNVDQVNFDEKIIKVLDIIERVRPHFLIEFPELVKEYSEKNTVSADKIRAGTNKKLWWKCSKCGYDWQATGYSRVQGEKGCPACLGKVVTETNNLAVTHPVLANAYYSSRNVLPATKILANSHDAVLWSCPQCGDERTDSPRTVVKLWESKHQFDCHSCMREIATEQNNLAALYPQLALEYNPKNRLVASRVIAGTGRNLWWRCSNCQHEWQATGFHRTSEDSACPSCKHQAVPIAPRNDISLAANGLFAELAEKMRGEGESVTIRVPRPPTVRSAGPKSNLVVVYPQLIEEYSAKNSLPANRALSGKLNIYWWKCKKCQYEWSSSVGGRLNGESSCPNCPQTVLACTS